MMNQLLSIKNFFEHKLVSNGSDSLSDKWLKRSDNNEKTNDFGKILKQRDQQEKPSKRPENFSQSNKKTEVREENSECLEENEQETSLPEALKEETDTFFVPEENHLKVEEDTWTTEVNELFEPQIPENFSTDEMKDVEDEKAKDFHSFPDKNLLVAAVDTVQDLKTEEEVPTEVNVSENTSSSVPHKTDLPAIKTESSNLVAMEDPAAAEPLQPLEIRIENVKTNPKAHKVVPEAPKANLKVPNTSQVLNAQTFEVISNTSNLLNLQHFDTWNNIGTKSAPKEGERKGGFVSSLSTVLTESEGPLHREAAISSNGSRVAEVLSQKNDNPLPNDSGQYFEGKEAVLPQVQPKVAVNTYETIHQDRLETVQGVIATLEQQMDEMKRARRNSVIVKVDLENGESLNCQVTLSRSDVAIRFPALEESFKMQILNHWESLKRFAQTRQLNLAEPHFIAQTSL